jgi:hypothetical protein
MRLSASLTATAFILTHALELGAQSKGWRIEPVTGVILNPSVAHCLVSTALEPVCEP